MSSLPNPQTVLAGLALVALGVLGGLMVFFPIPASNATSVATVVGALAGALTVAGGQKLADTIKSTSGPGAVVSPENPQSPPGDQT